MMSVTAVGSSWISSYLGDHVLFDIQADANTADTALAAAASAGAPTLAATVAIYLAFQTGGNWGHIKTLNPASPSASSIADIDGGAAA